MERQYLIHNARSWYIEKRKSFNKIRITRKTKDHIRAKSTATRNIQDTSM